MSIYSKDWREELIGLHPSLFGSPKEASGYPECGEGWRDILRLACTRIDTALVGSGHMRIEQIKEKYGTLRICWSGTVTDLARIRIEEAVALATARSACTCEVCGDQGRLCSRGGWLSTVCTQHARGDPVPIRAELENLHIVRASASDGLTSIISCRRYIRASDMFVDVDPRLLRLDP